MDVHRGTQQILPARLRHLLLPGHFRRRPGHQLHQAHGARRGEDVRLETRLLADDRVEDERVDPGASAVAIGEELGGKRVLDPVHQSGMHRVEGDVRRLVDAAFQVAGKVPEEARRPAVSHPDRLPRRRSVDTLRLEDGVVDHSEEGQPFRPPDLLGVGRPPVRLPDPRPEPSALLAARLRLAGGGGVEDPERRRAPVRNREERVDPGERVAGQVREDRRRPPLPFRRRVAPAPSSTGAGRAPPCRLLPFPRRRTLRSPRRVCRYGRGRRRTGRAPPAGSNRPGLP